MKIILSIIVLSIFLSPLSIANPTIKPDDVNRDDVNTTIAVVYSLGGLGDRSYNDMVFEGIQQAIATNPSITVDQSEPWDVIEMASQIEYYAAAGTYDLIISISYYAVSAVNDSATAHPSQLFLILDAVVNQPNVYSILFKEHEGSFLAGAMAAMTSKSGDIAFLGGLDIPLINKFLAGYRQGARYINPDITVRHAYSPDPTNPWGDLSGGKEVTNTFIEKGSDIIYAAAGGTGIGVIDAAAEASTGDKKVYAIGVDSNQDSLKKGVVLTSMMKKIDIVVETQIQAFIDGTLQLGKITLGVAEGAVGLSPMEFTRVEAETIFEKNITREQKIDEISLSIINGTIIVSEVLDDDFIQDPKTIESNSTNSTISNITTTSTSSNVISSSSTQKTTVDSLPTPFISLFISSFIIVFIKRRLHRSR